MQHKSLIIYLPDVSWLAISIDNKSRFLLLSLIQVLLSGPFNHLADKEVSLIKSRGSLRAPLVFAVVAVGITRIKASRASVATMRY